MKLYPVAAFHTLFTPGYPGLSQNSTLRTETPILGQSCSLVLPGNNSLCYSPLPGASWDPRDKKTSESGALQTLLFNRVPKTHFSEYSAFHNTLTNFLEKLYPSSCLVKVTHIFPHLCAAPFTTCFRVSTTNKSTFPETSPSLL